MPVYRYRCSECMHVYNLRRPIAERDVGVACARCAFSDLVHTCERVPEAPNFSVSGFNAKNGYSR